MRIVSNIIFVFRLPVFAIWIIVPIVFTISGYRFAHEDFRQSFNSTRILIVPLAVLLTVSKTVRRGDDAGQEANKVGCTAAIAICLCLGLFAFNFSSDCLHRPLFRKIDEPDRLIVHMSCWGGAHDSSDPSTTLFERKLVFTWLEHLSRTDTTGIDRSRWTRLPD